MLLLYVITDSSLCFERSSSQIPYSAEPFFRSLAVAGHKSQSGDLLAKSRIYVPKGRILMGVVDESGILAPNQVFIQCSIDETNDSKEVYSGFTVRNGKFTVKGKVTVAKNPCMHPWVTLECWKPLEIRSWLHLCTM